MPMSEPAKVSISPKAMSTEWCISPVGTAMNPHASNAHPKAHIATESINCTFFIINMYFSHGSHGSSRIAMDKISAHPCYPWEFSVGSCGIGLYRSGTTLHHTTQFYTTLHHPTRPYSSPYLSHSCRKTYPQIVAYFFCAAKPA